MKWIAAATMALAIALGGHGAQAQTAEMEFLNGLTPPEVPPYQQAVDDFNAANPSVHITQTNSPWNEFWQQLQVRTASGTMPDIWRFVPGYGASWLYGHQLLDITDYVKNDPDINLDDANQTMLKYMTLDGRLYGIGYDFNGTVVYYNPALFDKAGVPYPKDGWTTDELANAAKTVSEKLSTPDSKIWGLGGLVPDWTWEGWLHAFGATMITADGKYGANNDAGVAALNYFLGMINDKTMLVPTDSADESNTLFISGRLAMVLGSGHTITTFEDAGIDFGITKLPVGPAGQAGVGLGGSYVIDAHTKHPDEAYKFLKYITSGPVMAKVITTGLPARDSAMTDLDDNWKAFGEKLKGNVPFNAVNGSFQVIDLEQRTFANVWNGTMTPEAAVADIAAKADAILAEKAGQ